MKGLGASGGGGMPRFDRRRESLDAPRHQERDSGPRDAPSYAGPVAPPQAAPSAAPQEEDYNYTYMAPAKHKYELPMDRPKETNDWRYWLSLGLRAAAASSIGFLIYHSDLPYLLGRTRRRRDGTYGG